MNRVWKHFFKNLAGPVGAATYILAIVFLAVQVETKIHGGGALVISMFLVLPVLGWLVLDMWRDAKEKVERENDEMMRRLKGSDYK